MKIGDTRYDTYLKTGPIVKVNYLSSEEEEKAKDKCVYHMEEREKRDEMRKMFLFQDKNISMEKHKINSS